MDHPRSPPRHRHRWFDLKSRTRTSATTITNVEKHARNILFLGEMVGVSSKYQVVSAMLPDATRAIFHTIHSRVRPGMFQRLWARLLGRVLMKQAVGEPRTAVPVPA